MGLILVTGATGFLGHHLIPALADSGYQVRALVRPTSQTDFLSSHGVELAYGDVQDSDAVQTAIKGCDRVIHAAGRFRFWGDQHTFEQVNAFGTAHMLEAAKRNNVKSFIYISTVAVVGTPQPGRVIDETYPCRPEDSYQRSKYDAENLARMYHHGSGLPTVILRPGAFYGPWGHYAWNRLFFEDPLKGLRLQVHHGRRLTFPVFVPDVARAIIAALEKGRPGETYNVSGEPILHREANGIISKLADISDYRFNCPSPLMIWLAGVLTDVARRTGREPYYPINLAKYVFYDWNVSSEKARAELDFTPTPFEEGARQTVEWYREMGWIKSQIPKSKSQIPIR
ncbi:MAG: NAD-dependent epimerase/dehydratase family protein [Chloroflexota bacterium]